jgi:NadR type nicotinamide-nucleotide adenylyltransferase
MNIKNANGLVLGKFYPLHKGHQYLLSLAYHFIDELYIVVEEMPNETIPVMLRASWIKSLYPKANVLTLSDFNPQHPDEHPDFWNIWKKSLTRLVSTSIDYVFAGEPYGKTLAEYLDATFISSGGRGLYPISGTDIRNNPYNHWATLTEPVKSFYRKTVCICGPESTGKSTLSKNLAKHFDQCFPGNSSLVPEFARGYLTGLDRDLSSHDFFIIAKGQAASESALFSQSGPLQIIDTGINASTVWHRFLMGDTNSALDEFCNRHCYDIYLLCSPDVPWVEDNIRYLPGQGQKFFQKMYTDLDDKNATVVEINGSWEQRWDIARGVCEDLIG